MWSLCFSRLIENLRRLRSNQRGNVATITGLLLVPLVGATGYGIDYTNAVTYKLKLDAAASAAAFAGADAARALLIENPNLPDSSVESLSTERAQRVFAARAPTQVPYILKGMNFARVGETVSGEVTYSATVATTFTSAIGLTTIAIAGNSRTQVPLSPPDASDPNLLISENFDRFNTGAGYSILVDYNGWKTPGVELGSTDRYGAAPPNGAAQVGELDGYSNSSMSKKVYLSVGAYELRYWYKDRIQTQYPVYVPVPVCGSTDSDVKWLTEVSGTLGAQGNRIGVIWSRRRPTRPRALIHPRHTT